MYKFEIIYKLNESKYMQEILNISRNTLRLFNTPDEILKLRQNLFIRAHLNNITVGFLCGGFEYNEVILQDIVVLHDHQSKGVGSGLMKAFIQQVKELYLKYGKKAKELLC